MTTTQLRPLVAGAADWSSLMGAFFIGLSDPTRVRIVTLLLNDGEKSVGEIVEQVGLSQGRVSTHLACLRTCGFVSSRRDGKFTRYSVTDPRVKEILRIMRSLRSERHGGVGFKSTIDRIALTQDFLPSPGNG